jgi:hypothetical protein
LQQLKLRLEGIDTSEKGQPTHNRQFVAMMDQFMLRWQSHRQNLNRFPVLHERSAY